MSRPASITPYKNKDELLQARHLFYNDLNDLKSLKIAVAKVTCWQTRGKLPHAVDATAWIVSAILTEATRDSEENSTKRVKSFSLNHKYLSSADELVLRNAYSMALVRFVNGILDPFQQGTFAMALSALAKDIGLPYSFVEIRHCATHEQLPSLGLLRSTSQGALKWLYDNFWATLDKVPEVRSSLQKITTPENINLQVLSSLRDYKNFMKKRGDKQLPGAHKDTDEPEVATTLKSISVDNHRSSYLVQALISKKGLLKDAPLSTSYAAYETLLQTFNSSFLLRLMFALLSASESVNSEHSKEINGQNMRNILTEWLEYIMPMISRGPFPIELHHHMYHSNKDVMRALEVYSALTDHSNNLFQSLRTSASRETKKQRFAKVPSLEEILQKSTEAPTSQENISIDRNREDREVDKKRRKNGSIFEKKVLWDITPFGISEYIKSK